MSSDEAARRRTAWEVLSELFIDTEHDAPSIRYIAARLVETGFSTRELERMYEDEVAPVCNWDFAAVGPWPAFDAEWLVEAIERRRARRRPRWWRGLWRSWWTRSTRATFDLVRAEMEAIRGGGRG